MSSATFRHVNGMSVKFELLREMKHWRKSCDRSLSDVVKGLSTLREARVRVKREIHCARALFEERLREMEQLAEKRLQALVGLEEDTLNKFAKKLTDNQKKLQRTESLLKENLVGFKLKRTIDEGKQQSLRMRNALLEIRKYDMPLGLEFQVSDQLDTVIESAAPLGDCSLKLSSRQNSRNPRTGSCFLTTESISGVDDYETKSTLTNGTDNPSEPFDESDIVGDLEALFALEGKYEHSLKPFLDSVKDLSLKYNIEKVEKANEKRTKLKNSNRTITMNAVQIKQSEMRPKSAIKPHSSMKKITTRLSKSAQEEGRTKATIQRNNNTCLNDITRFVPFEEQGPEGDLTRKVRNPVVRYHDFDFVKEITSVSDQNAIIDGDVILQNGSAQGCSFVPQPKPRLRSASSQGSTGTSLSSVSYKPSNSLASRPVYVSASDLDKSSSYFNYIARFHTKKHPLETDLCRLSGIACLDNGQVVVTDINHLQIMLFGPDYHYLDALECPSPSGVTVCDDNTVAVALFHNRKIMLVKTLYDVVHRAGSFYVLCALGDVHVLDGDGKQTAVTSTRIGGGEARYIEVEPEQKRIFISGNGMVVCFDEEGTRLWQFASPSVHRRFTPVGLVLFNQRLFVTDWSAHRVLELSLGGSHVRDVIVDNVEYPHALTVRQTTGSVLVTQNSMFKQEARSRSIKVFQVK
ncbi:hypothetical protein MAR_000168 [Mya arenaria]|uniref:Uncharacterized protein n=1 Tax=Mya arenaria TaxID=6604 RepID=A0ABY7F882_MYAAR|nr:hypothetical protein MAR_000168 [Mya arenaria]